MTEAIFLDDEITLGPFPATRPAKNEHDFLVLAYLYFVIFILLRIGREKATHPRQQLAGPKKTESKVVSASLSLSLLLLQVSLCLGAYSLCDARVCELINGRYESMKALNTEV